MGGGKLYMLRTYSISCGKCISGEDIAESTLTKKSATEYFVKKGWKKIKGYWYCSDCANLVDSNE